MLINENLINLNLGCLTNPIIKLITIEYIGTGLRVLQSMISVLSASIFERIVRINLSSANRKARNSTMVYS